MENFLQIELTIIGAFALYVLILWVTVNISCWAKTRKLRKMWKEYEQEQKEQKGDDDQ